MFTARIAGALVAASITLPVVILSKSPAADEPIRVRIEAADAAPFSLTAADREELRALYSATGYRAVWIDADGRLTEQGWNALAAIAGAKNDGLEPSDYGVDALEPLTWMLRDPTRDSDRLIPRFDVGLSAALLRYLRELRYGRIDGRQFGYRLAPSAPRRDVAASIRQAVATDTVDALIASFSPPLAQYRSLRAALATYRSIGARGFPVLWPAAAIVKPGDFSSQLNGLAESLAATGDLADPSATIPELYDGPLVAGVKRFQARHGLTADGVIGPRTLAALRVTPTERIRQIELAMERLRWLPDFRDERLVAVNIPMFRAWAWDRPVLDSTTSLAMDVIVGRATRTETPVFSAEMREVIIRPAWNVPLSITRHELIPLIRKNPGYLHEQDMEVLSRDGRVVAASPSNDALIARLSAGEYRLRQRPGLQNPLGLVKFVFPNDASIYMHGTPAPELFARSRRDFSHGCIRVEDPVTLAEWALAGTPGWTRARILETMAGAATVSITLHDPVQVVIFYTTVVVDPESDQIRFADDVYGHDATLGRALAARAVR